MGYGTVSAFGNFGSEMHVDTFGVFLFSPKKRLNSRKLVKENWRECPPAARGENRSDNSGPMLNAYMASLPLRSLLDFTLCDTACSTPLAIPMEVQRSPEGFAYEKRRSSYGNILASTLLFNDLQTDILFPMRVWFILDFETSNHTF